MGAPDLSRNSFTNPGTNLYSGFDRHLVQSPLPRRADFLTVRRYGLIKIDGSSVHNQCRMLTQNVPRRLKPLCQRSLSGHG